MKAAVIGKVEGKPVLTNQAMHPFIALEDEQESHYVCACMNSSPFELAVRGHTQEGGKSFAQSNILEHIRIPRYDPTDPVHQRLAELSQAAKCGDGKRLREIEAEIDRQAARLWGLSGEELREIQRSLRELAGESEVQEEEEE